MIKIPINYSGLKQLSKLEQTQLKTIIEKEYDKLKYFIKTEYKLLVNIKSYRKRGKQKKFSVHIKIKEPFPTLGTEAFDWDLKRATHKAIRNLKKAIEHKYKIRTNPIHCAVKQILGLHRH